MFRISHLSKLLLACALLLSLSCRGSSGNPGGRDEQDRCVSVVSCDSLTVYYPRFTRIDLVTGKMPDKGEKAVIFCCAASFTGERLTLLQL